VQLPCGTGLGQTLTSNVTLKGTNCNVANSIIAGPVSASFLIPAVPVASPGLFVTTSSSSSYFYYNITNTGNTPLTFTVANFLPSAHLKNSPNSVTQSTTQTSGLTSSIEYFDCALTPTGPFSLIGNPANDANAPATNTTKFNHAVNNLLPGQAVSLYLYYDLTSSCSGPAGNPPYKDSLVISYNCLAGPIACIQCDTGGTMTSVIEYNPLPDIACLQNQYIAGCKSLGDTLDLCYEFENIGDAALLGGILNVQLPAWLQPVTSSIVYTGCKQY
jgi:hypothetical protein